MAARPSAYARRFPGKRGPVPKYELPVSGGPARQPEEVRAGGILYFDRSSYHLPGFPEDGGYQNGVYYRRDSAWGAG